MFEYIIYIIAAVFLVFFIYTVIYFIRAYHNKDGG
jgi:hypothetical protein